MSGVNRGKDFEGIVKACMEEVSDTYVLRLYDPQGGYAGVANPCDFVVYHKQLQMYMIECKSLHGNTLSIFSNDPKKKYGKVSNTQWEGMLQATDYGVVAGLLVWWIDKDVTRFIPIQEAERLRSAGAKSIRYDADIPNSIYIEGKKKRVYFDYDFQNFFQITC